MSFSARNIAFSGLSFWLVLCALCLYLIMPLRKSLRFGIDLVGGTYLTLEVQTQKAVEAGLVEGMQSADDILKRANQPRPTQKNIEDNIVHLTFHSIQDAQQAVDPLKEQLKDFVVGAHGNRVTLSYSEKTTKQIKEDAVMRNVEVLRTRMRDIPIAVQGENNIVIELPDTANPQEAKARIGKAAQLEFRLVEDAGPSREEILYKYDGDLPSGKEILPGTGSEGGFYLVEKYADVTGRLLKEAKASYDKDYNSVVTFRLNDYGADKFYVVTSKHYGKRLAIVLDGVVISAPQIREPISGGQGSISGNFTPESARELAHLLQSGSFVAPVTFEEERQIGPALGKESIDQGLLSCVVGMVLLFVFSLFYYGLSGFFAFLALVYNLVFILVGLAWLQIPLTLPGIGGMVLTVGMAIDASILIYEHIKAELARGVNIRQSVKEGFAGAMTVILDANITTFIAGVVLYYFGTGPIQGFAVTMMLGIISTLITGLFFLRSIFNFMLNNFHVQKLRI